jgi:hypothetical protein
MKDKWMNMGYEEEDLKPYIEPVQDWNDRKRIEILEVSLVVVYTSLIATSGMMACAT